MYILLRTPHFKSQQYIKIERVKWNNSMTSVNLQMCVITTPTNTKKLYNNCTMSAQRLRLSNIVQMLYKYFVLTGKE